jgi:cellulose synthase/poly-beta-1,6-N-acetylglucosamine synthase-like glycosyltransferase
MLLLYVSVASLLLLIYPYLIYPLILLLVRTRYRCQISITNTPYGKVALLFCAYNEEQILPAKIENIRQIKKLLPSLEARVYTDCCTDNSVAILREAGDVLIVHEGRSRVGKAFGMRLLVSATDAEIVIFTDANVLVEPDSVSRLVSYFSDHLIGTVAGTLHYTNPDDSRTARTGSLYWQLEESIKQLESDTGSTMGADGSIFAMRRALYPVVPPNLLDDMIASFSPMFSGYRIVSAPDVDAFERATTDTGDEFRRKRRIACRAFNTHRYLRPQLRTLSLTNRFKYASHKYLRWLSAVFLLLWLVSTVGSIAILFGIMEAVLLVITGALAFLLALRFDVPVVGTMAEIALSIFATGLGVIEAVAGRNYQTWTPPKSR